MYNVLIVEDEILVSIGLKNMIDWASLDMQVVGEARDGRAALALYQKIKPDLILTDIKMPVMDGLELIAEIRKNDKKTKIIILSCYEDFTYLHQAMKLGVTDYILKFKMSTEEMGQVIKKIQEELISENQNQIKAADAFLDTRLAREKIIKDFLVYQNCSETVFEKLVEKYKLNISGSGLILCIMQIDSYQSRSDKSDPKYEAAIREIIGNLVCELLQNLKRGEIVNERDDRYILLFSFGDIISQTRVQSLLFETLGRIRQIMKTYVDSEVTFGISSRGDHFADLRKLYHEAISAADLSYYIRDVRYIRLNDSGNKTIFLESIAKFRTAVTELFEKEDNYLAEILAGIIKLEQLFGNPTVEVNELFARLIYWPAANAATHQNGLLSVALEYSSRVRACPNLAEAMDTFLQYLQIARRNQAQARLVSKEVAEAVKFIRDNYEKELSLQQAADHVAMSANYLSSLFKKELQVSFIDYLNKVRIDRAGELLLATHLKSYDIARKVGFTDESYFSRIFKRIKGVRPSEYKKKSVMSAAGTSEATHDE